MRNASIACLAFGAHPDDIELFCAGILIKFKKKRLLTAVADLTRAELSTNGDPQTREREAQKAAEILEIDHRYNLELPDGQIENTYDNRLKIIKLIRKLRPRFCVLPYWIDRHPDHVATSRIVQEAIFYAGLPKIETEEESFRPEYLLYYMLHTPFIPTFVLDISEEFNLKKEAINAYHSQFIPRANKNRRSFINRPEFLEMIETRAKYFGYQVNCRYGEPYYFQGTLRLKDPVHLFE
jgi:bacillithiol biosynthesis deacetylase BshB1